MHPVYAAKKADPEGMYVRRWLPQLKGLQAEFIHCPWEAPASSLASAGVRLGDCYPRRVVTDLDAARAQSHSAVMALRNSAEGREHVLPSGHEWVRVNGRRVTLITRVDYREGSAAAGVDTSVARAEIQTKQTAGAQWSRRTRVNQFDPREMAMADYTGQSRA